MKGSFFTALLLILVIPASALAVSKDLLVPGALGVKGVTTFESSVTSTGPLTLESGANGNIRLVPNGTGIIRVGATIEPTSNSASYLGSSANMWKKLYVSSVGTGTIPITQAKLTDYAISDANVTTSSKILVTMNSNGGYTGNNNVVVFVTSKANGSFNVQYASTANGNITVPLTFDYFVIN